MPKSGHLHLHRVTYAECTLGNHVYHGCYLEWLEAARGEFFRSLGCPLLGLQNGGYAFPIVECRLRYHHPARYDDLLTVETWVTHLERVRLGFGYQVAHGGQQRILTAETEHACTDLNEKPRRIPDSLRNLLQAWLRAEADGGSEARGRHGTPGLG
jgi:acyl-CoA thioester hydrolase